MLQLTNITLHFGARTLFDKVTTTIKPGEKVGLIGRNGSGKSTLLKMISGEISNFSGQIDIPSGYRIGYLAQTVELSDSVSPRAACQLAFAEVLTIETKLAEVQHALENSNDPDEQLRLSQSLSTLYEQLHISGAEQVEEDIEKVLRGIGFEEKQLDAPISELSGGWKMRVELARLLLARPEILLLDEPTNHLDIESILWFESYLQDYAGIVIVVSHDQHVLNSVTRRTIEITSNGLNDFPYPYLMAMEKKVELDEHLNAAYENQQRTIAHKERLINKFRAKASKAKFAKSLQTELSRMDRIEMDGVVDKTMRLRFTEGARAGRVVYETKKLCKSFGEKKVINGLDLVIERGERISFVGQNGQGKTTLARMMAESLKATSGELIHGHALEVSYYAQNQTELLDGSITLIQTLGLHAGGETEGRLRSVLGSLLFEGDEVTKKVSVLSGGERARLSFACMVMSPCNVLILDEPTNHLDISSKEILKDALMQFEGTLIVVSHDMEFLSGLTDHTLEFRNGKISKHLYGIDEFVERRKLSNLRTLEMKTVTKQPEVKEAKPRPTGRQYQELKKEIRNLERKIEKLEGKKQRLEAKMGEENFYAKPDASTIAEEYRALCKQIDQTTEAWETAVSAIEE